ncbi:aminopeptidase [uncultured Treponema sp.]|uniref:aminopeptidase n=1 Tax=uncultured Treponema sp. TaxID=162155 RepID=UPI0025EF82A6|nr:aminopeptidase [uncultured Treponema sp.]
MKNESLINDYKKFLDNGKTERECVSQLIAWAETAGFKNALTCDSLKAGDKVYIQKMNKAIAFFVLGNEPIEKGMNILGAHIDSPRLDVKQNPLYEKDFLVYLNTHYYGGIKKYQWVTLPLAIHGVVCKKDGTTVNIRVGEDSGDPVFCISDILPHLAQKQMKEIASDFITGESLDLILGSGIPSKDDEKSGEKKEKPSAKKAILAILKEKYEIEEEDFGSAELEVVPAGNARDLGFDRSLILAYGQDDRSCAYTSARALIESNASKRTNCCICVDKEEIGSVGATGMESRFFENAVAEVIARMDGAYSDLTLRRCLANCNMLSSDVNAAFDPMNSDLFDKDNASFLNGGIVFNKYTGSRGKSGASDANPEFIARLRGLLDKANVKYQMAELGKVDQGGGGTIAYLAAKYGMNVLDAGVSVLAMHAPWEITAREDIEQAYEAYKAFLTLE